MSKKPNPESRLRDALSDAFKSTINDLSEEQALEVALDVAEEWRMRLDELRDDEED